MKFQFIFDRGFKKLPFKKWSYFGLISIEKSFFTQFKNLKKNLKIFFYLINIGIFCI